MNYVTFKFTIFQVPNSKTVASIVVVSTLRKISAHSTRCDLCLHESSTGWCCTISHVHGMMTELSKTSIQIFYFFSLGSSLIFHVALSHCCWTYNPNTARLFSKFLRFILLLPSSLLVDLALKCLSYFTLL